MFIADRRRQAVNAFVNGEYDAISSFFATADSADAYLRLYKNIEHLYFILSFNCKQNIKLEEIRSSYVLFGGISERT